MGLTNERIVSYLKNSLNVDQDLDADSLLFSSGALDSLAMVNLISFLEEAAGIHIRAEDVTLDNFDTAERIVRFADAQA